MVTSYTQKYSFLASTFYSIRLSLRFFKPKDQSIKSRYYLNLILDRMVELTSIWAANGYNSEVDNNQVIEHPSWNRYLEICDLLDVPYEIPEGYFFHELVDVLNEMVLSSLDTFESLYEEFMEVFFDYIQTTSIRIPDAVIITKAMEDIYNSEDKMIDFINGKTIDFSTLENYKQLWIAQA